MPAVHIHRSHAKRHWRVSACLAGAAGGGRLGLSKGRGAAWPSRRRTGLRGAPPAWPGRASWMPRASRHAMPARPQGQELPAAAGASQLGRRGGTPSAR
eukprot:555467-Alexandrium_andersonii.AAC.1